jgi:hypothetical protein
MLGAKNCVRNSSASCSLHSYVSGAVATSDKSTQTSECMHLMCQRCGASMDALQTTALTVKSPEAAHTTAEFPQGNVPTQTASVSAGAQWGIGARCELLGVNGKAMSAVNAALLALREAHDADERMQGEFAAMITLPAWALSQVCCSPFLQTPKTEHFFVVVAHA